MLRVAVACDGDQVSPHFGRCEKFVVAEIDNGSLSIVDSMETPPHEPGQLPKMIADLGISCIIAGGAGPRAVNILGSHGIQLIGGVTGPVQDALQALAAGELEAGESTCDH